MSFVKCSVDGCNRKLQPILKVEPKGSGHMALPGVRRVPETRLCEALNGGRGSDHL